MKNLDSTSLKFESGRLTILDQTRIPIEENWISIETLEDMVGAIKDLKVRGAPLIGVSAVAFLATQAERGVSEEVILSQSRTLNEARPTAVNLGNAMARVQALQGEADFKSRIVALAETIFQEDVDMCARIAEFGAECFEADDNILTHCNTGGLATVGIGTALGVIRFASQQRGGIHVYVDETRPLLQGGRLTTWELEKAEVPYTLICDNMAAALMRDQKIQKVIVGADRIARNGDFANKTGTYSLAVLCRAHDIPFYVAAPVTTIDYECGEGSEIPIEQRGSEEVQGVAGSLGSFRWAPERSQVYNPSFDVTPANLVSGWILDTGLFKTVQQFKDFIGSSSQGPSLN